jgi:hypothetical protein
MLSHNVLLTVVELPDLQKLGAGLQVSPLTSQQLEQLIATNRALYTAVLQLKDLLHGQPRNAAPPHHDTKTIEDEKGGAAAAAAMGDIEKRTTNQSDTSDKAENRSYNTTSHSRKDFERDNEKAQSRHERRWQTEIQRLESRVSHKCK